MDKAARAQQLLKPSKRFLPIAGMRKDGDALMVYGYLTTEAVDSFGTVFTLDATRAALAEYEKWRTLRAMHEPIAAGTVPVLELDAKGLWIGARVIDDREIRKTEEGVYKGFSIGFDPKRGKWGQVGDRDVWFFIEYELIEASLVDRNSNPETVISLFSRKDSGFLLAEKTAGWTFDWKDDADAILEKGGRELLAKATAWRNGDGGDADGDGYPDDKADYGLPVAKLAKPGDERLTLHYYAVAAAMAALNGAHEGVEIPEGDREAVHATLSGYYALFDEKPPELSRRRAQEERTMDEKQLNEAVEKAANGFFTRMLGKLGIAPKGEAEPPKVRVKPEALEAVKGVRATLAAGTDEASKKAAADLDALLGRLEAEAPETKAAAEPKADEAARALEARLTALETENKTLKEGLDKALSQRQSATTVDGDGKPFKSRYGGAFFPH